jgi:hypothetical protein
VGNPLVCPVEEFGEGHDAEEAVGAPTVLIGLEDAVADGVVVPAAGLGDEGDTELYARYFAFIEEFGGDCGVMGIQWSSCSS